MQEREKQIDEMANDLAAHCPDLVENCCGASSCVSCLTRFLHNAGYRKQEWISVEERLPEKDGCYITYTDAKGSSNGVIAQSLVTRTIRGIKVRRWEWQTKISPWITTHWMPLPEAPKMKGGDGR